MPNEQDERDRRREEALKLCFDGCKQMAIISAAVGTIFVTFYREKMIDSLLLAIALSSLALSILTSLIGMLLPISRVTTGGGGKAAILSFVASIGFFVVGVVTAAQYTVNVPDLLLAALLGIFGVVIGVTIAPMILTRQEEEPQEEEPQEEEKDPK